MKANEELLDFDKPAYQFVPPGRHEWRQQGPYLVCISCELKHAVYVGINKMMVGEDDSGKPIMRKRSVNK